VTRVALVTGIAGQTGSYLAENLAAHGWRVHGLVRPGDENLRDLGLALEAGLHEQDLADGEGVTALVKQLEPDTIFHLGGLTSVGASWQQPHEYAVVTGASTATILDSAQQLADRVGREVGVVHASSAEIFGDAPAPQDESTPIAPTNPYGAAKALGHHLVQAYRQRGVRATNAILFNHESPRRPPAFVTRKITQGVARIVDGRADSLVLGALDARRDWGWAPDYADALRRCADVADDLVIATGESHSIRDFVDAAFAHAGIDDWERYVQQDEALLRPAEIAELRGSPDRARAIIGWEPTLRFRDIVARMVDADRAPAVPGRF
jgi:GDPmannose 4,6-dehydratase